MVNCDRCGRLLTDPRSVARGYGPVCWKRLREEGVIGGKQERIEEWFGVNIYEHRQSSKEYWV